MSSLEQYGIKLGNDTRHELQAANELSSAEFFAKAKKLLESVTPAVRDEVIPQLEVYEGRWHPNGFMVFPLGMTEDLSSLRLHIWPRGERIGAEKGLTIHDHSWYLVSRVLEGTYSDEIYDVRVVPAPLNEVERVQRNLLRVYSVDYKQSRQEEITTDGICASTKLLERRVLSKDETHSIDAGVFHSTTVGNEKLVATLILNSRRISPLGPYVLLDSPGQPIQELRQPISDVDKLRAKEQLLKQ